MPWKVDTCASKFDSDTFLSTTMRMALNSRSRRSTKFGSHVTVDLLARDGLDDDVGNSEHADSSDAVRSSVGVDVVVIVETRVRRLGLTRPPGLKFIRNVHTTERKECFPSWKSSY